MFDCLGAGQKVSQHTFSGRDWRGDPEVEQAMFAVFPVVRALQELLCHLTEAVELSVGEKFHPEVVTTVRDIEHLTHGTPDDLLSLDLDTIRDLVNRLLNRTSESVRREFDGPDHRGALLIQARLARKNLAGASFRGAILLGADLSSADCRRADFTGADLRGANLAGADLGTALFLTSSQLLSARGDTATRIPTHLPRPPHWNRQRRG